MRMLSPGTVTRAFMRTVAFETVTIPSACCDVPQAVTQFPAAAFGGGDIACHPSKTAATAIADRPAREQRFMGELQSSQLSAISIQLFISYGCQSLY
jgi:hypothetical protein